MSIPTEQTTSPAESRSAATFPKPPPQVLWPRTYYFISGLLYPGALGVALMWFVEALTAFSSKINSPPPSPNMPTLWAVAFAGWFTVYHSLLFVRLMDRYDQWCSDAENNKGGYDVRAMSSDIVDSAAMFMAFAILDFKSADYHGAMKPEHVAWLFCVVILVPLSALLAHKDFSKMRIGLVSLTGAISSLGAALNFGKLSMFHLDQETWNCGLLVGLWVLLAVYWRTLYLNEHQTPTCANP
jgi:hypothetical protein